MRILCIGAHPDDCEIKFGGTALKFARSGHAVKFLSLTNGSSGHHEKSGAELSAIRRGEAQEAAARLGVAESEVLHSHDGALQPDLETRWAVIRQIRNWNADLILTHRACDYHPDHRYTSQLVQDAAYLVMVPSICPETPPLRKNPVFVYFEDQFRLPTPFEPEVAVRIDDVWSEKIFAMDAHQSQFYEWLPWIDGKLDQVPKDAETRRQWLSETWARPLSPAVRDALRARYAGKDLNNTVHAEAFQLCEYGGQPTQEEMNRMFPC